MVEEFSKWANAVVAMDEETICNVVIAEIVQGRKEVDMARPARYRWKRQQKKAEKAACKKAQDMGMVVERQ